MSVITTINIEKRTFEKIEKAALEIGVTKSECIKMLIKMFRDKNELTDKFGIRIKYQKRDKDRNWHRFHIKLLDHEYEYLLDLRRFCKLSVANILDQAVDAFLSIIIKEKPMDKNVFGNYIIMKELVDNIVNFRLYWGFPPDMVINIPL